ncbi:hypothetical protein K438DRAFT_1887359, partial [Mycena galopus ATCC 62051]
MTPTPPSAARCSAYASTSISSPPLSPAVPGSALPIHHTLITASLCDGGLHPALLSQLAGAAAVGTPGGQLGAHHGCVGGARRTRASM